MTVAMSGHDYEEFLRAVAWIEYHAGDDAPEYPRLDALHTVVENISMRQEPDWSQGGHPSSATNVVPLTRRR